ncbi:hypothetical protein E2562_016430 [Oryza meyeriana var. granulata]|uniref:Uncharacterized protein n=1 Tax=Oryza meyeriana var. granulata TaxID=110450 RepID=A0A6G1EX14_9ORYZ|nr:hypothetical protein E2562_016430 [Oryza meyeriana var. granulata]
MAMHSSPGVFIRRVTVDNLAVEMNTIRALLHRFPVNADEDLPPAERYYKLAKARVDELAVLQLGITLCNNNGRLPVTNTPCGRSVESAWQVGFSDFDLASHQHLNTDALATLRAAGIDFEDLRARGVPAAVFAVALFEFGIVSAVNHGRLTWVAFGGLYDFGFLLKILTGGARLPETGEEFAWRLRAYLGNVYDAKYVATQLPVAIDPSGGLVSVARLLGAPAVAVEEPRQAGEKSLVACEVFMRMTGLFFAYHDVAVHVGKIDGLQ